MFSLYCWNHYWPTLALSENHVKESSAPVTSAVSSKRTGLIHEHTQPPPNPIYSAGFRECISRLGNYIDSVDPSQRESFVQELRDHLDAHSACPLGRVHSQTFPLDLQPWGSGAEGQCLLGRVQNRKESTGMGHQRASREATFPYINTSLPTYPNTFVLHHPHPTQHLSHPYPSPPYSLSPPPSPSYSSSSTPITITSPYLSMPCHFPFSPSPSEHRSDSLSSSSHSTSLLVAPLVLDHTPLGSSIPTPLCPSGPVPDSPTRTLRRSLFQIQPQAIWRPWPWYPMEGKWNPPGHIKVSTICVLRASGHPDHHRTRSGHHSSFLLSSAWWGSAKLEKCQEVKDNQKFSDNLSLSL